MSEERVEAESDEGEELAELDAELDIEEDGPEPEPEIETDGEPVEPVAGIEPPASAPRVSREARRIRALRERQKAAEEEVRRLRQQNEQMLARFAQPQAPTDPYRQQLEAQQELDRVMQMQPHEMAQYYADKSARSVRQEMANTNVRTADQLDRMLFEQIVARDGTAKRYAARVEEQLASLRSQGMNFPREVILNNLVGQEVRERAAKAIDRQARGGRQRIAAQTTRAGSPRSNVPAQRGGRRADDSDEALIARLKSVTVGEVW